MLLLDTLRQMFRISIGGSLRAGMTIPPLEDDAPPLWQLSSFELMNGIDVTGFSDVISGETLDAVVTARGR